MGMIEVRTSDLVGKALDWAVAQVESRTWHNTDGEFGQATGWLVDVAIGAGDGVWIRLRDWSPSTDWNKGGPLIEKHGVALSAPYTLDPTWDAYLYSDDGAGDFEAESCSTPLIAVCRVIVAAKLGDVVRVPAELVTA